MSPTARAQPIKILFLAAHPSGTTRLAVDREAREITQRLRCAPYGDRFELVAEWAVRVGDLQAALLRHRPHILHFSGHGRRGGAGGQSGGGTRDLMPDALADEAGGGIVIEDEAGHAIAISPSSLGNLLHIVGGVRCVVLNACHSAAQAEAMQQHADCVVVMGRAIEDSAAIGFSWAFYQALGFGEPVEKAFELGKNQIDLSGLSDVDVPRLLLREGHAGGGLVFAHGVMRAEPSLPAFKAPPRLPVPAASMRRRGDAWRPAVTIELRLGGTDIERNYHDPVYGPGFSSKQRFDATGLGHGDVARHGRALFEALFGSNESHWGPVLRAAFRQSSTEPTAPTRYPLRVRVCTTDARLMGLPWSAAQWKDQVLSDAGWTFEICRSIPCDALLDFQAPGRILLVASTEPAREAGEIDAKAHWEELKELIGSFSRGPVAANQLRMVHTREELLEIAARMQPEVVYYYGTAVSHEGELYLQAGAGPSGWIAARDLADLFRRARPKALLLNARWADQANPGAHGFPWFSDIPLVLSGPLGASAPDAAFALQWFRRWLREREDPVVAAHPLRGQFGVFPTRSIFLAHTLYETWTTRGQPPAHDVPDRAEDWFDREKQRVIAYKHITDMARYADRTAEAIVAYGKPGNSIEKISQQILDYIEQEAGDRVHILRRTVQLPAQHGAWDSHGMEHSLKIQLGFGPDEPLRAVLASKAPRISHNAARVLWLDWQVLRGLPSFSKPLYAWLEFVRDRVAPVCPPGVRIVASIALEADGDAFHKLHERLPELRSEWDFRTKYFRCTTLEPLDVGTLVDIADFLDHHGCPAEILNDLANVMYRKTQGRYDDTTELLRAGFARGWHALLHQLLHEVGKVSRRNDF